jgi:hypothetical protein
MHQRWVLRELGSAAHQHPHSTTCRALQISFERAQGAGTGCKCWPVARIEGRSGGGQARSFFQVQRCRLQSKKTQREVHVAKTNLLTLNLICAAGIPPSIVDNPAFRALANHLEPNNGIVVGSTFSSAHIPAEAARVTLLSIKELK